MENLIERTVVSLEDTEQLGVEIARRLNIPCCVYLDGEMGAGKTTLTKSILQGLGYDGPVTSPTYNLIQEYEFDQGVLFHMDLYRLNDSAELEYLALEDLWSKQSIFLIEWPQKGSGYLPKPDFIIELNIIFETNVKKRRIMLRKVA